jgi:hypothetical protein
VDRSDEVSRFLSVPFKITNSGEVAYTTSPKEVIKQYVACVILTNLRERIFRPPDRPKIRD